MNKILIIFYLVTPGAVLCQKVGINTDTIHPSAVFEIKSDSLGFLGPRLDSSTIYKIENPQLSLLVYQIDGQKGYKYFDGQDWVSLKPDFNIYNKAIYENYDTFRKDTFQELSNMIFILDFKKIINNDTFITKGGIFLHDKVAAEDGGVTICNKTSGCYTRLWDGVNVYPNWWEIYGYDAEGNTYIELENSNTKGIRTDFDRVANSSKIIRNGGVINLEANIKYKQNIGLKLFKNTTLSGNGSTFKRNNAYSTLTSPSSVGSIYYDVAEPMDFKIGMNIIGISGKAVGDTDLDKPSSYHTITNIVNNRIYFNTPSEKPLMQGDIILQVFNQVSYEDNVTIRNMVFDGNKSKIGFTESWNHNNCIKSTLNNGLRIYDSEFINMPSDCITSAGETWIENCIVKNLNACFVHGSSGSNNDFTKSGVFISNVKADSICLSLPNDNGHTSQHGFYVQSIGTNAVKIRNCRITNIINGGVVSPLTNESDEFSLVDNYFENCSHLITNISTSNIYDTKIIGNTIKKTNLSRLGGSVTSLSVYKNFNFSNNYVENSLFHFSGVSNLQINNNQFILNQNNLHSNFNGSELSQVTSYNAVLVVGGVNCSVNNNLFRSYYEDSIAHTAVRFNVGGVNNNEINLSISDNRIYNFSNGIISQNGSSSSIRHGINISDNYIEIRNEFSYGEGIGIRTYFGASVINNLIKNGNNSSSIKVYGNLEDPLTHFGCIVKNNTIMGSDYSKMLDVYYYNNIVESNLVQGGINFQNATYKSKNIVGANMHLDKISRTISEF